MVDRNDTDDKPAGVGSSGLPYLRRDQECIDARSWKKHWTSTAAMQVFLAALERPAQVGVKRRIRGTLPRANCFECC
jgi:hypothetical protein